MPSLDLNHTCATSLDQELARHQTIIACLCAAWCDVCVAFRPKFDALADQHPELLFLWVDIEDQAEVVGDLDIDNFPTMLIQQHNYVTFYGTMQPDSMQLHRLIKAQEGQTSEQLHSQVSASSLQLQWQTEANLRKRLSATGS